MKTKLFLILVLFFNTLIHSQNKYSFYELHNQAYHDLVNDLNITDSFDVNTGLYIIPGLIGESFNFFDQTFPFGGLKTIAVGEGPFLRVDNDSSLVIVDVAFTYIDSIDPSSKISYLLQGSSGNMILKTQYKNYKLSYGPTGNFINVQIWYYQQNGVIELRYGSRSANNASGYNTIQGPNIGIFYSPDDFSGCYEKLWCNGPITNVTLDSAANYVFNAMSGVPDSGTVYRFVPRSTQTVSTVGLKKNTNQNWSIGPNPASDFISISGNTNDLSLSIYDLNGRLVKTWQDQPSKTKCSIADLSPGCYILEIRSSSAIERKKIILDTRH
ncbi:MAG: T9SS type A sorting domain-containing protein [Bacteroidia bacterium]|nr:T9SS type A sorting domain-containing protein [Bacteroidia bacterium]